MDRLNFNSGVVQLRDSVLQSVNKLNLLYPEVDKHKDVVSGVSEFTFVDTRKHTVWGEILVATKRGTGFILDLKTGNISHNTLSRRETKDLLNLSTRLEYRDPEVERQARENRGKLKSVSIQNDSDEYVRCTRIVKKVLS